MPRIPAMKTFKSTIEAWPGSLQAMASDINKTSKKLVTKEIVYRWKKRNSIPAGYWVDLVKAGAKQNVNISLEALAKMARQNLESSQ